MSTITGVPNTGTLNGFKRHYIVLVGGLCIAVASVAAGAYGLSVRDGGAPAASPAAHAQFQSFRSDWKYVYYLVATQEQADEILAVENAARNELAASGLELPHRSVNAIVVNSPEQEYLVGTMLAEVDPEFVQFVDLRFAPPTGVTSDEPAAADFPMIEQAPSLTESLLFQPYPCSEGTIDEATAAQLALYGNCQ